MKKISVNLIKIIRGLKIRKLLIISIFLIMALITINIYRASETHYLVFDEIIPKAIKINQYELDGKFYEEEKILEVDEKIIYTNKSKETLNSIYFHIYPNVFKEKETTPFRKEEMNLAYPEGFEPGYLNIKSVKSSSSDLAYLIMGKDSSILKVNLDQELYPNEKTTIYIKFMVKLPPASGRFGYGKNTINLGNWYPIASVIDEKGWNLEPYHSIGDPFYSEVGSYRVTMIMPPNYIVASTGDLVKKENIEGGYKWTLEAEKVRDFALIASTKFKVIEAELEDITIRSYYFEDEAAEVALNTAKDSIRIFGEIFGKYPYKHFSVAASDFFIGGMEYPKLVFIDEGMYKGNDEILEYVIAHEVAHQWWYGIVGNNEIREAWLDEALTEYSTMLYYEMKYSEERKKEIYKKMVLGGYDRYRGYEGGEKEVILKELKEFKNSKEYQALVYCKGAMLLESLREELGDQAFFDIMKIYFDKYKYKNATTENFIEVCEIVSDKNLEHLFNQWLMGGEE